MVPAFFRGYRTRLGVRSAGPSFRVVPRLKQLYAAATVEPFINAGIGRETSYVLDYAAGAVSIDLPIAIGDPLAPEDDATRLTHLDISAPSTSRVKPFLGAASIAIS